MPCLQDELPLSSACPKKPELSALLGGPTLRRRATLSSLVMLLACSGCILWHLGTCQGTDPDEHNDTTEEAGGRSDAPDIAGFNGWNWTVLALVFPYGDVDWRCARGDFFLDCYVFHTVNSTHSLLWAYNTSSDSLNQIFWSDKIACRVQDFRVIGAALYLVTGFTSYPIYNGTVYKTTDLSTWDTVATTDRMMIQSIGQYAPTGSIYVGGVHSGGKGTYTRIGKIVGDGINIVWSGRARSSDDGVRVMMFNSTHMVVFDEYNLNFIISNNPDVAWTDSNNVSVFEWGTEGEVRDGLLWAGGYDDRIDAANGGLCAFNGTHCFSYDLGMNVWNVVNGSVGVCEGLLEDTHDFPGSGGVYLYNATGTLWNKTAGCTWNSRFAGLAQDPSHSWVIDGVRYNRLYAVCQVPTYNGGTFYVVRGDPPGDGAQPSPRTGRDILANISDDQTADETVWEGSEGMEDSTRYVTGLGQKASSAAAPDLFWGLWVLFQATRPSLVMLWLVILPSSPHPMIQRVLRSAGLTPDLPGVRD